MFWRIIAVMLALSVCTTADTGEFPSRTVTIISPYQAGGASDIIARILAQKLSEQWGKTVIVENRPGANGGIGVTAVTRFTASARHSV
jgi:tripartite-type tricarboxylate transporter receptor subunit TctC